MPKKGGERLAYDGTLKFDTSMDASGFQKGANKLGDIVKGAGVFKLLEAGMTAITNSIDGAVSRYDSLNRFSPIMQQMGYSAEDAEKSIDKLSTGIQGLPTTLDGIVNSTKRLAIATGDLDKGTESALALNNALFASGASADAASRGAEQYVQALSRGKIEGEEWKTLMETMPYAMQQVAQAFGYAGTDAVERLRAAMSGGEITMAQFNDKLIELNGSVGGFAEMAKTATGGISTAWTNMQTAIVRGVTSVITAIDKGLSQTSFESIANVISGAGRLIESALSAVAPVVGVLAANLDILAAATAGVVAAFAKHHVQMEVAKKDAALVALEQAAASKAQAAQEANLRKEMLATIAAEKASTAETLKAAAAKATGAEATKLQTQATKAATAAEQAQVAATKASAVAQAADTAATEVAKAAQDAQNASIGLGTAVIGFFTGEITLHALAQIAAAAATKLFDAAVRAIPFVAVGAAVAALVMGIISLVKWIAAGTKEFQEQKEEVKALTDAQEELATATDESASAYEENAAAVAAAGKVSREYVKALKDTHNSTMAAEEKQRKMAATVAQLNACVDGLNIAYDEEKDALYNINTGQEVSLAQLEQLVDAKAELAEANAWQERANELVQEQVQIQEELAVIETKRQEINANEALTFKEKAKLIAELNNATAGYADTMADVESRLSIANENIAASNTAMAESAVAEYERAEQALAEYEEAAQARSENIINSFKRIPAEYEMSAQEMIDILRHNREQYAEWEQAMVEISGQVSAGTLAELEKLGPGALSAIQEMRANGGEGLREFDAEILASMGKTIADSSAAWNSPTITNAPNAAFDAAAQQVAGNTAIGDAVSNKIDEAKTAAAAVDFSEVGQGVANTFSEGVSRADVTSAMASVVTNIQESIPAVTEAATAVATALQTVWQTMQTQAATIAAQMMTDMSVNIIAMLGALQGNASTIATGIVTGLEAMVSGAQNVANRAMDGILSAMNSRAQSLYAKANEIAVNIARTMAGALEVRSPSRVMLRLFGYVMIGIYNAMDGMTGKLYGKAKSIADGLAERLTVSPDVAGTLVQKMRTATQSISLGGVAAVQPLPAAPVQEKAASVVNLYTTVNTHDSLSESEITRELEDFTARSLRRLP